MTAQLDPAPADEVQIPAGEGRAFRVRSGQLVEIVAIEGPQVADMWAFAEPALREFLSTEHTRSCLDRLTPYVGQAFYSNLRRPMLTIVADSSPGRHDLLLSACDKERYRLLGHHGPHRSCVDNLHESLAARGQTPPEIPAPVNVFENVAISAEGTLEIRPPLVEAGGTLTLRAEVEATLVVSACPMDIVLTNGTDRIPKPVVVRLGSVT